MIDCDAASPTFSRAKAFERNLGLVSRDEQERLGQSLIAIAGCGGVGGFHAHTLARLGVGRFRLTDPDTFSLANFNRQIGATIDSIGRNKAEVTAAMIRSINPEAQVEVVQGGLTPSNARAFVGNANLVVDGVDFFAIDHRRRLFGAAWEAGIPALTAAPLGFSGTLHVFARGGMSFDEYFDLHEGQETFDQLLNFFIGLAPAALHLSYMDLSSVNPATGRGPSSIIGCQLAASLTGAEALRILLGRGASRLAPAYLQFDAYRQKLRAGRLRNGNRNWLQRLKRSIVARRLRALGFDQIVRAAQSSQV
ncbi:MAG TPA: ThiF family adenylyltransferase [Candidatus Acidoferrales bacterium]|nr:ThiF family adenylyltransferase [Candidatus Acidoferrales bacterium]